MRLALPLTLVALVFLAGCGGVIGSDVHTSVSSTPAPVPTDAPVADLPGLSETGISDPEALAATNAARLNGTSFTVIENTTATAANSTELYHRNRTTRISTNHSRSWSTVNGSVLSTRLGNHSTTHIEQWFDGTRYVVQAEGATGTEYFTSQQGHPNQIPGQLKFYYGYPAVDSVTVSTAADAIVLRIDASPTYRFSFGETSMNVTDQTVTVRLTEKGRVERFRIENTGRLISDPNMTVEYVSVTQYTAIGETTIERPDWLSAAHNATITNGDR